MCRLATASLGAVDVGLVVNSSGAVSIPGFGGARVAEQSGVLEDLLDHLREHLRDALLRLRTRLHENHSYKAGENHSVSIACDATVDEK